MGCQYCYLGTGTEQKTDTKKALETLKTAISLFLKEQITPFNLSFHGGEATAIPEPVLAELLEFASQYYQQKGKEIKQAGYPLNPVHIKTNLFNFDKLYSLFERYKVSISGSVDLPLCLHDKYRTDKRGRSTLDKITRNLKLLAQYPHHKKISCVVTQEHYEHLDQFIADIKYIHYDIGLDMSKFNVMFAFDSNKNQQKFGDKIVGTEMLTQQQQVNFYNRLKQEFTGTELEQGLKQHWFKEFTPEFCCSAVNCGDKFFLLQSNGDVYACPRGQSSRDFYYGNIFKDSIPTISQNGWQTIESLENTMKADENCFTCNYLPYCNQGCVFVRDQTLMTKSYTCHLQKELYKDDPVRYPAYSDEHIKNYAAAYRYKNNIQSFQQNQIEVNKKRYVTEELYSDDNSLQQIIESDEILKAIYAENQFIIEINGTAYPLSSPILQNKNDLALITANSQVILKVKDDLLTINSKYPVNNALMIMLLRNTLVSYGDEGREKQEHLVDYSLYQQTFMASSELKQGYYHYDFMPFLLQHRDLFINKVRNNLYFSSKTLREYHYAKQKKNAFYHIQAINLPFPYLEFYWRD